MPLHPALMIFDFTCTYYCTRTVPCSSSNTRFWKIIFISGVQKWENGHTHILCNVFDYTPILQAASAVSAVSAGRLRKGRGATTACARRWSTQYNSYPPPPPPLPRTASTHTRNSGGRISVPAAGLNFPSSCGEGHSRPRLLSSLFFLEICSQL